MGDLEDVRKFLSNFDLINLEFKKHFYDIIVQRPISDDLVKEIIKKPNTLLKAELQKAKKIGEKKYKLWFKLSNKYSLVLIAVISKKNLYILTGWNTDRKWQKSIQR